MMGLMPCKDFITNRTAPPPPYPSKCCDGYRSLLLDTPICLCHVDDGGLDEVMAARIDGGNFLGLVTFCQIDGPNDSGSCDGKFFVLLVLQIVLLHC
jgi:hypothetical protein